MKSNFITILSLTLLFVSCQRNNVNPAASIVFGEAYGFCVGDCAHFYEIKDNLLYRDTWKDIPGTFQLLRKHHF